MTYAWSMLSADAAERSKKWDEAIPFYNEALRVLLYRALLPIGNPTVQGVVARRHECYRRIQSVKRLV